MHVWLVAGAIKGMGEGREEVGRWWAGA